MNIAKLSVRNPVFANLLLAVMIIGGIASYHSMPREVFPEIPLDMILIRTQYIGAPPEEVEKQVTIPIENVVVGVENIESIASQSYENVSLIEIHIKQGTKDLQKMVDDIKEEIDRIDNFPEDMEEPDVILIESEMPVINIGVSGTGRETVKRKVVEELKNRLMHISGVARIQESGLRDIEIWAEVDPFRISALNIPLSSVSNSIATADVNLPAGKISGNGHDFPLRTSGNIKTAENISRVVITRDATGREVRVGDVASVTERFEERQTLGRVDGEDTITMFLMKTKTGSTIEIVEAVREEVEKFKPELPAGISVKFSQDSSRFIRARLQTLYRSGTIGLVLVCIVLFLFLNWRMAIWTAIGIPASFAGALLVMDYLGITVNMMSLFALILVLGMVVDDAIIVTENVFRYMESGMKAGKAAVLGTSEVFWPIVAATATTIAAFMPMLMMSGIMGKFIANIPVVVTITLLASFVEAFFILPSHLADYGKPGKRGIKTEGDWFYKARKSYRHMMRFLLKERYKTIAVVLLVFGLTVYYAAYHMKFVLFNSKDLVGFVVKAEMPTGSSLEETARAIKKVETLAVDIPKEDLSAAITIVGMHLDYSNGRIDYGSALAQTMFESTEFHTPGRRNAYEVMEEVREKVKLFTGFRSIEVLELGGGPPIGTALEARISGDDYVVLREIVRQLKAELRTIPGVKDIKDNFNRGKDELHVMPRAGKTSLFGITAREISSTLKTGFDGTIATSIKRGTEDIDVRVIYAKPYREDKDFIPEISIVSPKTGKPVRLSTLADVVWSDGLSTINHFNQKRTIKVFASVDTKLITSSELTGMVKERFADISEKHPGYSMEFGGEAEEQNKSVQSLIKASVLGLLLIYLILGTLFKSFLQPIVVIAAIPFSFTGVVLGHELMGEPIGMLSLIGLAALTGIVVNDSLVMVDFINQSRLRNKTRWRPILQSAFVRFRPVILTSLTTIFGLSTLAFQTTGQAAFLAPMAISIVFGLVFSTILTLIVIPCAYAILDDLMIWRYGDDGLVFKEPHADEL